MKKILFVLIASLFVLAACSEEEPKEETKVENNEETKEAPTEAEVKEIIEFNALGENDKLISSSIENGEIKASIELGQSDTFSAEDMAVTRYSQASDALIEQGGWETLTITYENVGTISMNYDQKETNDYDMGYFPTEEIRSNLKK